jgi:hypothetical protein
MADKLQRDERGRSRVEPLRLLFKVLTALLTFL